MGTRFIMTATTKKKIVLSQTCQGLVLERLLMSSREFKRQFACTFVPNYEIHGGKVGIAARDVLESALSDCDVLIYHDISCYDFPALLQKIPPGGVAIKIPYITSTIYWPTYDYKNPCWLSPCGNTAHIPWPCLALNGLIVSLRDKRRALEAYLEMDIAGAVPMDAVYAGQIAYLEEAEQGSPFAVSEFISRHVVEQQLFHLINHPAMPVFVEVANTIFRFLGLPEIPGHAVDPFSDHQMPIHPSVVRHYGISWCDERTRFKILDKDMCFEEYVAFYIDRYVEKYRYAMFPAPAGKSKGLLAPLRRLKHALGDRLKAVEPAP